MFPPDGGILGSKGRLSNTILGKETLEVLTQMIASRKALVTGAASGIGRATAERLARRGVELMLVDRQPRELADLGAQLGAFTMAVDVSSAEAVTELSTAVEMRFGTLDILIVAHGIIGGGAVDESSLEDWDNVLSVNLTSVYLLVRGLLPLLRRSSNAAIVTVASIAALTAMGRNVSYSAAKGGVVALTRELAIDLAAEGIRVNAVCPGPTDTPLLRNILVERGSKAQAMVKRIPLRRFGRPEEVASVIDFLASIDASYVTGQAIVVDGGYTTW